MNTPVRNFFMTLFLTGKFHVYPFFEHILRLFRLINKIMSIGHPILPVITAQKDIIIY